MQIRHSVIKHDKTDPGPKWAARLVNAVCWMTSKKTKVTQFVRSVHMERGNLFPLIRVAFQYCRPRVKFRLLVVPIFSPYKISFIRQQCRCFEGDSSSCSERVQYLFAKLGCSREAVVPLIASQRVRGVKFITRCKAEISAKWSFVNM